MGLEAEGCALVWAVDGLGSGLWGGLGVKQAYCLSPPGRFFFQGGVSHWAVGVGAEGWAAAWGSVWAVTGLGRRLWAGLGAGQLGE